MKKTTLEIVLFCAGLVLTNPAMAQVDLIVTNFSFMPGGIEPQAYPDRVKFTLGNYGPLAHCDVQMEFFLSRNTTLGDGDDQPLASFVVSACLNPGQSGLAELPNFHRSQMVLPADATGQYHLLLRVQPYGETDPDPSDNVTVATNILTVIPPGPIHANFANSSIITSNMNVYPGWKFAYNDAYGNSWRLLTNGAGFTATFTAPSAGTYSLHVRHATSSSGDCPNNGYAPVTIALNGTNVVTDYDVAANHASYWYENDTWTIQAVEGENTLTWVAGDLCTHYWLQRFDLWPEVVPPQIQAILPIGVGQVQLSITGQAGRTNIIEVSSNLVSWTTVTNVFNASGTTNWLDSAAPAGESRFYRLLQLAP